MTAAETMRQQFLAAAAEIAEVYRDTSGPIGYDGRQRVQKAYVRLQELAAWIPDTTAGWLPYSDMPDKDLTKARRRAEDGWASPQVILQLIRQVLDLRQQLSAIGGTFGVTDDDIRSMLAEGFATAWRKAADNPESVVIMRLIKSMDPEIWGAVIDFVADPLIAVLREAGQHAEARTQDPTAAGRRAFRQYFRNAGQEPPDWDAQDQAIRDSWTSIARAAAGSGKDITS
jgi:hypothetical protein